MDLIVLYYYKSSRGGDHAREYLKGFKGFLHCDGYSGYNKFDDVTRCGCWVHLRRKFVKAIPDKKAKDTPLTNAEIGRDYCIELFKIEPDVSKLLYEEKYSKRLELEKPVLDAFWCWLESLIVLNGSSLVKQ